MADAHFCTGDTALMEEKIRLFIFPNEPSTQEEILAFNQAVSFQLDHENSKEDQFSDIPRGAQSFKIGDFSITFENGANDSRLTRKTICQAAYSVLLRAGLLYRGLEGRC